MTTTSITTAIPDAYSDDPAVVLSEPLYRPHGVALHPHTRDIYVTSSDNKLCMFHYNGSYISVHNPPTSCDGDTGWDCDQDLGEGEQVRE
jgi:hypothetical protein